jgi:excisionase family DNA binding protein
MAVNEVADKLRVSRDTVVRLIRAGELTAIKTGEARTAPLRVLTASLDEFLERHTVPATTHASRSK